MTRARSPLVRATRIAIGQQLAAHGGNTKLHLTLLVNSDGRVAELDVPAPGLELGAISTTMSYEIKVNSRLPAANQVVPLSSIVHSRAWTTSSPWDFRTTS